MNFDREVEKAAARLRFRRAFLNAVYAACATAILIAVVIGSLSVPD